MENDCHYFYEPSDQRDLDNKPVIKDRGTKIRLCGKGKHVEEITERLKQIGFRDKGDTKR